MVHETLTRARETLLAERTPQGWWVGRLSSSATATAIAVFALSRVDRNAHEARIRAGLRWLAANRNADGGWGDSPESPSNVTATLLCWCALSLADPDDPALREAVRSAERWLTGHAGALTPQALRAAILKRYGDDRTFAGPILMMCALAGRLDDGDDPWRFVPQLPFELSVLPHTLFRWLRITVVSYALPALIAIGLVRHRHRPSPSPLSCWIRNRITPRALGIAERMQPPNGGYEEAPPLTSFVAMALSAAGYRDTLTVRRCASFLVQAMRDDGSWPIDTSLATWVTVLSVNALAAGPAGLEGLSPETRAAIRRWILDQQCTAQHPLTFGAAGGWPWSDLPGAMPDADDTPGALVALRRLGEPDAETRAAAARGIRWLLDLQNRDGGIPTFSRGWGKLPFDRSCPDITAHVLRACDAWYDEVDPALRARIDNAMAWALAYLADAQSPDGAWNPLWFGNQYTPGEQNPVYGTAQVVIALRAITSGRLPERDVLVEKGSAWLAAARNADGGWGGGPGAPSSVEETACAVTALAGTARSEAAAAGLEWLIRRTEGGRRFDAAPIGLYFARLWYSEKLYPVVFAVWALGAAVAARDGGPGTDS